MRGFLKYLSAQRLPALTRYGGTVTIVVGITVFRLFVPLDTAPFLLYLPIIFLVGLALGTGPGAVATLVSATRCSQLLHRA